MALITSNVNANAPIVVHNPDTDHIRISWSVPGAETAASVYITLAEWSQLVATVAATVPQRNTKERKR